MTPVDDAGPLVGWPETARGRRLDARRRLAWYQRRASRRAAATGRAAAGLL